MTKKNIETKESTKYYNEEIFFSDLNENFDFNFVKSLYVNGKDSFYLPATSILKCKNLEKIDLSWFTNKQKLLDSILIVCKKIPSLKKITLFRCINNEIPLSLTKLTQIEDLHISVVGKKFLSDSSLSSLINIKKLILANFSNTEFPDFILKLKKLEQLSIESYNFSNIPSNIDKLTKLKNIFIFDVKRLKYLPNTFQNLDIDSLTIFISSLSDSALELIYNMKSLKYLRIQDSRIHKIKDNISNLQNLTWLSFGGNPNLTDISLGITELKKLKTLYLDSARISSKRKSNLFNEIKYLMPWCNVKDAYTAPIKSSTRKIIPD